MKMEGLGEITAPEQLSPGPSPLLSGARACSSPSSTPNSRPNPGIRLNGFPWFSEVMADSVHRVPVWLELRSKNYELLEKLVVGPCVLGNPGAWEWAFRRTKASWLASPLAPVSLRSLEGSGDTGLLPQCLGDGWG